MYIFGYSRGAYTARSLAGMIRNCGVLERRHVGLVPKAVEIYRSTGYPCKPSGDHSRQLRAEFAAHVQTCWDAEMEWRRWLADPEYRPRPIKRFGDDIDPPPARLAAE